MTKINLDQPLPEGLTIEPVVDIESLRSFLQTFSAVHKILYEMDEESADKMPESVSLKIADDAVPVCPDCLSPCDPRDNYCPNCGSNEAINPLVPYLPFEGIRFVAGIYAKLLRKTWDSSTSTGQRVLYICLFLLFMPVIFLIALPFMVFEKLKSSKK